MKILFLANYYFPHVGGVEKHVEKLSQRLKKKGNSVFIVTQKVSDKDKFVENRDEATVYRFNPINIKFLGLIFIWIWFFRNRELIKNADIVHAHDVGIWYWPFRLIYRGKPFYMTFHGYEEYPVSLKSKMIRKVSEVFSKGNICIGKFMEKWYGTKPTIISYGAVDRQRYKPSNSKNCRFDALFMSRLDEQTGILTYIDAIKGIKDFKLLVLGDGVYRKYAEKYSEVRGFVKDTSGYLQEARFSFSSRYLALLESFASKKLVFAVYDTQIKKDYLVMTSFKEWIVIEKSPDRLKEKIKYYQKNPDKAEKMVNEAYEWVKDKTWEKMAENYLELWGKNEN